MDLVYAKEQLGKILDEEAVDALKFIRRQAENMEFTKEEQKIAKFLLEYFSRTHGK